MNISSESEKRNNDEKLRVFFNMSNYVISKLIHLRFSLLIRFLFVAHFHHNLCKRSFPVVPSFVYWYEEQGVKLEILCCFPGWSGCVWNASKLRHLKLLFCFLLVPFCARLSTTSCRIFLPFFSLKLIKFLQILTN